MAETFDKDTKSREQKQAIACLCRDEVSKTKSKVTQPDGTTKNLPII